MAIVDSTPQKRGPAKRLCIFNHKGGVGKTTLTYNICSEIAAQGKNVLIVDSDPQCNLTAYVIDNEVLDDLLDNSDTPNGATVWSAVRPIVDATGPVNVIPPIELDANLWLIPGDIRLSDFEGDLNDLWRECFQRKRRGLAGTAALSTLINEICSIKDIDVVFYDTGPNIGPLNRVIFLDCDYFIVPASYDLFSIRALKTLGRSLYSWMADWETIVQLAPSDAYLMPGKPKFLGYIPQNFSVYGGKVASHQQKYAGKLERGIQSDIVSVLKDFGAWHPGHSAKLGEVKDFGQLVSASQMEGRPIAEVSAGSAQQRARARSAFKAIAEKIIRLIG